MMKLLLCSACVFVLSGPVWAQGSSITVIHDDGSKSVLDMTGQGDVVVQPPAKVAHEPAPAPKVEKKAVPKQAPKIEPKTEPKAEQKAEPAPVREIEHVVHDLVQTPAASDAVEDPAVIDAPEVLSVVPAGEAESAVENSPRSEIQEPEAAADVPEVQAVEPAPVEPEPVEAVPAQPSEAPSQAVRKQGARADVIPLPPKTPLRKLQAVSGEVVAPVVAPLNAPEAAPADPAAEISRDQAVAVALDFAPPSRTTQVTRREWQGHPVYEVVFKTFERGDYVVIVDRKTGEILHRD